MEIKLNPTTIELLMETLNDAAAVWRDARFRDTYIESVTAEFLDVSIDRVLHAAMASSPSGVGFVFTDDGYWDGDGCARRKIVRVGHRADGGGFVGHQHRTEGGVWQPIETIWDVPGTLLSILRSCDDCGTVGIWRLMDVVPV